MSPIQTQFPVTFFSRADPTCLLTTDATSPVSAPFTVTITFSRSVTGFTVGDIDVTNATLDDFIDGGAAYTVTVSPITSGDVTVRVPAGVCQGAGGRPNQASNTLTLYTIPVYETVFTQSLDAEVITNWNMETGDPPTGWTGATTGTLDGVADERTGGAGVQSLSMLRGVGQAATMVVQRIDALATGTWFEYSGWARNVDASSVGIQVRSQEPPQPYLVGGYPLESTSNVAWTQSKCIGRSMQGTVRPWLLVFTTAEGQSGRFDDQSAKPITLNAQQTMPADAIIDFAFELPATPVIHDTVALMYRIAGTLETADDFWVAYLYWTGTAWRLRLDSVANGVATNRANVNDAGAPDTIRVRCVGTEHHIWTLVDGAATWRGTVTVSHNDDETGVNVVYCSGTTPISLRAWASS